MRRDHQRAAAVLALALLAGCGGGSSGGTPDPVRVAWYDLNGDGCSVDLPRPGCYFHADGRKIEDVEDPYFTTDYTLAFDTWDYLSPAGMQEQYVGFAWLSPSGILYDDFGFPLN